jgi:DNA-binding CsgD family transcriptional regulator
MNPLPPSIRRCLYALTARELEVLALLAQGRSAEQIGGVLAMTPRTAAIHGQRIARKLNAEDARQAVAIAFRDGILTR